ncbi:MAG TPA: carotenoid biosynthesis protein [Gemmatimonadaceae bacterium]|nr:carotenoid biosynthesis protein [Gemmatimonadaceae bacterium]
MEHAERTIENDGWSNLGLYVLVAFTAVTVVGYATFGVNPSLLNRFPGAAEVYSQAFRLLAVTSIWLAWLVLAFALTRAAGARWLPAFLVLYSISLGSELLGTITGLPFGNYRYSPLLAPMWLGHVPIVIPLSWFFMAVPSYALARSLFPSNTKRWTRVLIASALLVSWDLSLDPAMSFATQYWTWASSGAYYGMPWMNLLGWYVTGLALMTALSALDADRWIAALRLRWVWGFYLTNLALPTAMNAAFGLWGAVISSIVALALVWFVARYIAHNTRPAEIRQQATVPPLRVVR